MGGSDINNSPTFEPHRYVINFGQVALADAERWPDLIEIVRARVKPFREQMRDHAPGQKMKKYWWQFYSELSKSRTQVEALQRCLVVSRLSKHVAFCFQPKGRVLGETLRVFFLESYSAFGILQSRCHRVWAERESSSRGDGVQYDLSRAFVTFPFPKVDPRVTSASLEAVGRRVYETRAKYMADENAGLTVVYNRLKDPACDNPRVLELRKLHEEMDRKVLEAYADGDPEGRWLEVEVPPFCPTNHEHKKKLEGFEDAVIDRLFVLNAKRAEQEKIKGLGAAGAKTKPEKGGVTPAARPPKKPGRPRTKKAPTEQLAMVSSDPDAES